MNDTEKLNQIRAILGGHSGAAYETPELFAVQIPRELMDGTTILADGSTWTIGVGTGEPEQVVYGHVNQAKDPAMWEAMRAVMGDEMLERTFAGVDPWTRYRANPRGILTSGQPNAVTLAGLFNNPLPAIPR